MILKSMWMQSCKAVGECLRISFGTPVGQYAFPLGREFRHWVNVCLSAMAWCSLVVVVSWEAGVMRLWGSWLEVVHGGGGMVVW